MRSHPLRVLVIDDSAYHRSVITSMLQRSPLVEVVGFARDGEEALRKTFELAPDLVTLDLAMPRMDGFTFLRLLMDRRPTAVIVVSGRAGADDAFKALELGAVDFIAKPTLGAGHELPAIEQELIRKVHALRALRRDRLLPRPLAPALSDGRERRTLAPQLVAIGASTGGPAALVRLLGAFPEAPPCAFAISQHMPAVFTRSFAERLDRLTSLHVREAEGGEEVAPGTALVAPGGSHLEFESVAGRVVAKRVPPGTQDRHLPAVDRMFESAAKHFGAALLAVVLTGMGDDGRRGVAAVKAAGGSVIAESEETAVIFGMPQQAIRTGMVDAVLPLAEIAAAIQHGLPPPQIRSDGEEDEA